MDASRLEPNLPDPDGFHAALVAAMEAVPETSSLDAMLRLVLLLANQIEDEAVLRGCITEAVRPFRAAG